MELLYLNPQQEPLGAGGAHPAPGWGRGGQCLASLLRTLGAAAFTGNQEEHGHPGLAPEASAPQAPSPALGGASGREGPGAPRPLLPHGGAGFWGDHLPGRPCVRR